VRILTVMRRSCGFLPLLALVALGLLGPRAAAAPAVDPCGTCGWMGIALERGRIFGLALIALALLLYLFYRVGDARRRRRNGLGRTPVDPEIVADAEDDAEDDDDEPPPVA
jgi:hypothetical protein